MNNPNYSFGFFFINSETICNKNSEELDYLKVKWEDFKKAIKDTGINIELMYYKSIFDNSNKLYDNIADIIGNLLERPIDENKIASKDDSEFIAPTFDLSHEENLDSISSFKDILRINENFENKPEIFVKNTKLQKNNK